jgi:hypothetical protein
VDDAERYKSIDLPYYEQEIRPFLPSRVLDFHAHVWSKAHWNRVPSRDGAKGGTYMVVETEYLSEDLLRDARRILPGREYRAVCFGYPTPAVDVERTNAYVARTAREPWAFPLMIAGRGLAERDTLERTLGNGGFYGYKVYLPWHGDEYGDLRVQDMLGPVEMELADRHRLVVLLHVPRAGRLADPAIREGVCILSSEYPGARIVLAHCGRCYHPDQMKAAAPALGPLDNVYLDSSMVMDPLVLQILLEHVPSERLLFGTDFPVPAMRGRRVYVLDHWVDLVLPGYPESAYRVQSENIRASFMVYEIIQAIRRAAERVGLTRRQTEAIFHDNGASLLGGVQQSHQR